MYEFIKIDGKKHPIKFGFNALRNFSNLTGISLKEMETLGEEMTIDAAITLIWCGLKDGARASKETFIMTIEDVADAMDEDMTIIDRAMKVFINMMSKQEKKSIELTGKKNKK